MLETCGVLTPIPVNSLPYQRLPAVGIAIDFPVRLRYGMDNNRSWNMPWMLSLHGSFWARLHVFAAIREGISSTNTCLQLFDSVAYWLVYASRPRLPTAAIDRDSVVPFRVRWKDELLIIDRRNWFFSRHFDFYFDFSWWNAMGQLRPWTWIFQCVQ